MSHPHTALRLGAENSGLDGVNIGMHSRLDKF
jgi:hypothetical protein